MNYLVLNGKNSRYIQGLLIQELPPISKPMMRTKVEEIDGRDGDIITELGFKAYDKVCKIALTRNYDVDDVSDYFNSEGEVTFSNEPTLFYKYKITAKIDYERLIRFKTANVTFHVQPFKYSRIETPLTFEPDLEQTQIKVINQGNYKSQPTISIYGTGQIVLALNGTNLLTINLGSDEEYITIDTENLEAYKGTVLKNRLVSGDYDKFSLIKGENIISWSGNVSKIIIDKYSRWI